jgi:hypothetical protein
MLPGWCAILAQFIDEVAFMPSKTTGNIRVGIGGWTFEPGAAPSILDLTQSAS